MSCEPSAHSQPTARASRLGTLAAARCGLRDDAAPYDYQPRVLLLYAHAAVLQLASLRLSPGVAADGQLGL